MNGVLLKYKVDKLLKLTGFGKEFGSVGIDYCLTFGLGFLVIKPEVLLEFCEQAGMKENESMQEFFTRTRGANKAKMIEEIIGAKLDSNR
ncbi:hypothetical protein QYZ87_04835 [Porphyromonadaceae bacterium W3.11]|nr:hypothetical protein [Porphyromonadaceae bacterium W3.11]